MSDFQFVEYLQIQIIVSQLFNIDFYSQYSLNFSQCLVYLVVESLALLEVVGKEFRRGGSISSLSLGTLHWSKLQSKSNSSLAVKQQAFPRICRDKLSSIASQGVKSVASFCQQSRRSTLVIFDKFIDVAMPLQLSFDINYVSLLTLSNLWHLH